LFLQKRGNVSLGTSLLTPPVKRKKVISKVLISSSDDSSDEDDRVKSSPKKVPSSELSAVWKIDRLKASLQKPASEPKDKQSAVEPRVQKQLTEKTATSEQSAVEPRVQKQSTEKNATSEEQSKESKEKVRKEETSFTKEKLDKKLSLTEVVPKTPTHVEDRLPKDASSKSSKHSEQTGLKPLEKEHDDSKNSKQTGSKPHQKGSKNDAKQRQSYVIPKVKKPAETTPKATTPVVDTWSDMLRRGAELQRNRSMQMTPSSGMSRIPKIPKASLCGQSDVGVLDKIEKDPGFLRWEQAASQRNISKSEDKRNSASAKSNSDMGLRQQHAPTAVPSSSVLSDAEPSKLSPVTPVIPLLSVKPLLPTLGNSSATSSLLPAPPSARKKVLLPTPGSASIDVTPSTSSRAIPVLVGRGKVAQSATGSSPVIADDTFVPTETADQPG